MINAKDIMHQNDLKAMQVLKEIPYVDSVCRKIMEYGYERIFRGENLATMVKATFQCLPRVFLLMKETAKRIGINTPEVYVYNDPIMNAFTYGETTPFVCISSSCVEKLNDEELICLMAHECGHILCKHTLYNSVVNLIQEFGERMGIITRGMSQPIYLALQYWSRQSEYSADRCAAVVTGERIFQQMTMKMASGLTDVQNDPYQLVRQAREYKELENGSLWDKIQQNCRIAFYSHPQIVNRAYEIDRWKNSFTYKNLVLQLLHLITR